MDNNRIAVQESPETEMIPNFSIFDDEENEERQIILNHRVWLKSIRHERPSPRKQLRVGIYIRFFNQTKHKDYLENHMSQYRDTMALCPNWELVDFYVDEGSNPPNMESAPEWMRLLQDCFDGKVDLIITQKVSNVSRKDYEISFVARTLAALKKPVGIYFVSEDIFTLASYYQDDLRDTVFFPDENWQTLPDDDLPLLSGGVDA